MVQGPLAYPKYPPGTSEVMNLYLMYAVLVKGCTLKLLLALCKLY